ncbi:hypothetical protein BpHYR1_035013 [Brachionus plicatilis]|uniref:Uncharacterized protein n=1 Tax=Brachionus plicatilis TaxID=10195 RepID=A0A3M7SJY8_BRAPC|nr:hypothetical protein BpHYR1_035013 [Brachionus plicatilis]
MENAEEVLEFLDNDRTSVHFNFVKFTRNEENQDGSIRFKCCKCSITRSSDNENYEIELAFWTQIETLIHKKFEKTIENKNSIYNLKHCLNQNSYFLVPVYYYQKLNSNLIFIRNATYSNIGSNMHIRFHHYFKQRKNKFFQKKLLDMSCQLVKSQILNLGLDSYLND